MKVIPVKTLRLGLEDHKDGTAKIENELMYLAKFDFETLKQSSVDPEKQEQYELRSPNGTIRMRRINDGEIELCTKTWKEGVNGRKEAEMSLPPSADMFENFMTLASHGQLKVRYFIPIDGTEGAWKPDPVTEWVPPYEGKLVWEVDVFYIDRELSAPCEWCKIDLEIPAGFDITNHPNASLAIPEQFTEVFTKQLKERTPEDQKFVTQILTSQAIKA